jgi:hypothetical protein
VTHATFAGEGGGNVTGDSSSTGEGAPPAAEVPLPSLTHSHLVATNEGKLAVGSLSMWRVSGAFNRTQDVNRNLCAMVIAGALLRPGPYSAAAEALQAAAEAQGMSCSTHVGAVLSVGVLLQGVVETATLDCDLHPGAPLALCSGRGSDLRLDGIRCVAVGGVGVRGGGCGFLDMPPAVVQAWVLLRPLKHTVTRYPPPRSPGLSLLPCSAACTCHAAGACLTLLRPSLLHAPTLQHNGPDRRAERGSGERRQSAHVALRAEPHGDRWGSVMLQRGL